MYLEFLYRCSRFSFCLVIYMSCYHDKTYLFQGRRNIIASDSGKLLENKVSIHLWYTYLNIFLGYISQLVLDRDCLMFYLEETVHDELICCLHYI